MIIVITIMLLGYNANSTQAPDSQQESTEHKEQLLTMLTDGTYYPVGIIFSTLWNEELSDMKINVSSQSFAGSVENLNMLKSGEADLGIAVSDFGYYVMAAQKNRGGRRIPRSSCNY